MPGFEHPVPDAVWADRARAPARRLFFEILDAERPQVLGSLRHVWGTFASRLSVLRTRAISELGRAEHPDSDWLKPVVSWSIGGWLEDARGDLHPLATEFDAALRAWARKWRLETDWVLAVAIWTIDAWEEDADAAGATRWRLPSTGIWSLLTREEMTFTFSVEWDPTFEAKPAARQRIEASFRQQLQAWTDGHEDLAHERGYPKLTQKHELERHIRWLVRFQLHDDSYAEIAQRDPHVSTAEAVSKGVREIAELLGGVPLRHSQPGRPSKK